jgi:peptide/nickel transport system substrate-binding protein
MQFRKHLAWLAAVGVACGVLAACSSSNGSGSSGSGTRVNGGTATIAETPGNVFNWIFPLLNYNNDIGANLETSEYLMWRPLYWFGTGAPTPSVGLNEAESVAYPPRVSVSGKNTVATIQLKSYKWSDGTPVTSRDVQFWINLVKVNPSANWWGYVPGQFPDNVLKFTAMSPTEFSITFKGSYKLTWLYNELGMIIPVPQHAWDKESASGKVGNYDLTRAGAAAVVKFLLAQNSTYSTYATNPLWQVVDGPWKITSYAGDTTGDATYVRNMKYSGPATGSLHELRVISYTSDTAEFDSLLSAGGIDFGYVPYNDSAEISRVESDGYTVKPWPAWGITFLSLNYGSPQAGPIFKQLYVRQAMQHLINQAGYINEFLQGYGNPTYGPVPLVPKSQFLSAQQQKNPYPYDPTEAGALLKAHGWQVINGVSTCTRPGSGPADCGPGVHSGAKMAFNLEYATGTQAGTEEDAALQSSFAQVGIKLSLSGAAFNTVVGDDVPCSGKSSCWQMNYYNEGWYFDPAENDPDGTVVFQSSTGGGYANPTADSLMSKLPDGGLTGLYRYENYLAQQLPVLWMPEFDYQITAVNSKLKGVFPQDPDTNLYPEDWYYVK